MAEAGGVTHLRLILPHSEVLVYPDQQYIATKFPDGSECGALREDTDENRREAADQGYTGSDAVWRSLADHELGHSLVSLWLWDRASPTLQHEAGAQRVPYGMRLGEEAIVIAFQRWMNKGDVWPILTHYREQLPRWKQRFLAALNRMEAA